MAGAIELATAYIQVVPSLKGSQAQLTDEILPAVENAGSKSAAGFTSKFKTGMEKLGGAKGIALGLGAGIVAGFAGLYKIGEIFDDVADTIRVGTGASGSDLDGLVDSAKKVGKQVPVEFGLIGPAIADVNTRMGLTGPVLEKVSSQYLAAGKILGSTVDINKTSAAFTAFGIEGAGVETAMDDLFRVSQATGVGMNELASQVKMSAPVFTTLGLSFDESAAMMGSFDKAGLNSQQMAMALSKGIVTLAKDGEKPGAAFKRVSAEIGKFVEVGDEAAALNLASKVFGTRGATQFVDALKQGKLKTEDLMGAIGATSDTILGVAEETYDFGEQWQLIKNKALTALEPLGAAVFDGIGGALNDLAPLLESFGDWLGDNTWVIGAFATVIGVTLVGAFAAWTVSIWAATAALLANPITWIVIGVGALIAGLIALIANWDAVVAWISDVWAATLAAVSEWWDKLVSDTAAALQGIADWVTNIWNSITDFFSTTWDSIKRTMSDAWNSVVRTVSEGITSAVNLVKSLPGKAVSALASLGSRIAGVATSAWNGFRNAISNGMTSVVNFVKTIPSMITGALSNAGSWLLETGKNVVQGFLNGIGQLAGKIGQFFLNLLPGWIVGPFKFALGIASPSKLFRGFGQNVGEGIIEGVSATEHAVRHAGDNLAGWVSDGVASDVSVSTPTTRSHFAAPANRIVDPVSVTTSTQPAMPPGNSGDTYLQFNVDVDKVEEIVRLVNIFRRLDGDVRAVLPNLALGIV